MKIQRDMDGKITWVQIEAGYCDGSPVAIIDGHGQEVPPEICSFVDEWMVEVAKHLHEQWRME